MVLACTLSGVDSACRCQPEAVSPENVTDAGTVPVGDQMRAVWTAESAGRFVGADCRHHAGLGHRELHAKLVRRTVVGRRTGRRLRSEQ